MTVPSAWKRVKRMNGSWRAELAVVEDSDGRKGVLKQLTGKGKSKRVEVERFEREIAALQQLASDPGVLRVLDASPTKPGLWHVTEYADLLRTHVRSTGDLADAARCGAEIARTLAGLHGRGIYHRDLKPDNLFWIRGRAVVGDFGLVTTPSMSSLTNDGRAVGSAHFLAPEFRQFSSRSEPGPADVYALAQTIWVLAHPTATYPPGGPILVSQNQFSLLRFGDVPAERLLWVLQGATRYNPRDRLTMERFADELDLWCQRYPTTQPPPRHGRIHFETVGGTFERELAAAGRPRIVRQAVLDLVKDVRELFPGSASARDLNAEEDEDLGGYEWPYGDWEPQGVESRVLQWDSGDRKVIVESVESFVGDFIYLIELQQRSAGGAWTLIWSDSIEWRTDGDNLRLPSDFLARDRLLQGARAYVERFS